MQKATFKAEASGIIHVISRSDKVGLPAGFLCDDFPTLTRRKRKKPLRNLSSLRGFLLHLSINGPVVLNLPEEPFQKRYFYGVKIHVLATAQGQPVEFLTPGSFSDVACLEGFDWDLPPDSTVYADTT